MEPTSCVDFRAEVYVLYHSSRICLGFQTVIHVGNVMQTATIIEMSKVSSVRSLGGVSVISGDYQGFDDFGKTKLNI